MPRRICAWQSLCRALFTSNEFNYVNWSDMMRSKSFECPLTTCAAAPHGLGFAALGLDGVLGSLQAAPPANPLAPKRAAFPPRAKRVIFLFMHGGASHVDTFDPKPRLQADHGKPMPFKRALTVRERPAD